MESIFTDIQRIVDACHPESREEAQRLWREIKPARFGNEISWVQEVGGTTLASYQIPEDAGYLAILRVKCYVYTNDVADSNFRNFEPPPGGNLQWVVNVGAGSEPITALTRPFIMAEVEEFLLVKQGLNVALRGVLAVPPAANRLIRTLVYAYHVSALIADQIGSAEVIAFGL